MKNVLAFFVFCNFIFLNAQNLVKNPSFEACYKLPNAYLFTNTDEEFKATVVDWSSCMSLTRADYFTRKLQPSKDLESAGYHFKKIQPHTGDAMLRFELYDIGPKCNSGCSAYIYTKLTEPVKANKIYTLSFWFNLQKTPVKKDILEIMTYFGAAFSNDALCSSNNEETIFKHTPFNIDTFSFHSWIKVSFTITPKKDYAYLTLGVFNNIENYKVYEWLFAGPQTFYFFLDDIEIKELVNPSDSLKKIAIPFHSFENKKRKPKPETLKSASVYFNTNKSEIDGPQKVLLDTLIAQMKVSKNTVYNLCGHTDNIGSENLVLSQKRVETVKNYLVSVGNIAAYRLTTKAFGSDSAIAPNTTEAGRILNRRVELTLNKTSLSTYLYGLASDYALENKPDSAFYYLKIWMTLPNTDKILLLHDTDLASLHKKGYWKAVENFVKDAYKNYPNPQKTFFLDNLYFKDQKYRTLGSIYEEAKGYVPVGIDTINWGFHAKLIEKADSLNGIEAFNFLAKNNYPNPAEIGIRPASAIFYTIQHGKQEDMQQFLPTLLQACKKDYAPRREYAMMFDRILLKEKGMQRYGTQYVQDAVEKDWYRIAPLENPTAIDSLREEMGLQTLDINDSYRVTFRSTSKSKKK
jgi:outer membrane protein OmpA-like peptidoglycan-associated protein